MRFQTLSKSWLRLDDQLTAHNRGYGERIEGAVGKNMLCAFPLGL